MRGRLRGPEGAPFSQGACGGLHPQLPPVHTHMSDKQLCGCLSLGARAPWTLASMLLRAVTVCNALALQPWDMLLGLAPGTCPWDLPLALAPGTCPWDLPLGLAPGTCPWDLPLGLAPGTCLEPVGVERGQV